MSFDHSNKSRLTCRDRARFPGDSLLDRIGRVVAAEVDLGSDDLIVSAHACGTLTDRIIERAVSVHARVAVLPCCHAEARCDVGGLGGWLDPALAIDVTRAGRLRSQGYRIHTQVIPGDITPKNRLLLGEPQKRLC